MAFGVGAYYASKARIIYNPFRAPGDMTVPEKVTFKKLLICTYFLEHNPMVLLIQKYVKDQLFAFPYIK